jgi:hypothetical protein
VRHGSRTEFPVLGVAIGCSPPGAVIGDHELVQHCAVLPCRKPAANTSVCSMMRSARVRSMPSSLATRPESLSKSSEEMRSRGPSCAASVAVLLRGPGRTAAFQRDGQGLSTPAGRCRGTTPRLRGLQTGRKDTERPQPGLSVCEASNLVKAGETE